MVNFEERIVEKTKREMTYAMEREKELPPSTIIVKVEKHHNFLSAASREGSELVWYSDETKQKGGEERGPSPLSYFLSSMGLCQFVHYAEHSMMDGLRLDSLRMKISGTVIEQRPRRFSHVAYEVTITGPETDETIRRLALQAAEDCYVTNTLKRACGVTGIVIHNGMKIDEHR